VSTGRSIAEDPFPRRRLATFGAAVAAVVAAGASVGVAGCARDAVPDREVPHEVVDLVESAPDDLDAVLAPEAAAFADPSGALPEGTTVDVRPGTWSEAGATASLVADVTLPSAAPVAFLVVLAAGDAGGDADGWLIAGTFTLDEP
jgi:hypothetical protein